MGSDPGAEPFRGRESDLRGRRIAGYVVEAEIGRGGMAVVYRAHDVRLDRTVALKLLAPELARNDVFRQRFAHESKVAAAIDHPHIVPVFEAGETDGMLYIAMRYVAGQDLRAMLDRTGPLPVEAAARIAGQVASALDAAHAHDLVHRDVKPGNILVAGGTDSEHPEHVYLTDFGLTKKSLSLTGFTSVGQFVGTLDYVAPEQIAGKPVDGRCDVYSLGCVVYETLAGGRRSSATTTWPCSGPTSTIRRPPCPPGGRACGGGGRGAGAGPREGAGGPVGKLPGVHGGAAACGGGGGRGPRRGGVRPSARPGGFRRAAATTAPVGPAGVLGPGMVRGVPGSGRRPSSRGRGKACTRRGP